MNDPEIKAFIIENKDLFWYTPDNKKEDISLDLLVETILNYGSLDNIRKLIKILGIKEVSNIFFNTGGRKKLNYYPEVYNFFSIYFTRNAQRDTI